MTEMDEQRSWECAYTISEKHNFEKRKTDFTWFWIDPVMSANSNSLYKEEETILINIMCKDMKMHSIMSCWKYHIFFVIACTKNYLFEWYTLGKWASCISGRNVTNLWRGNYALPSSVKILYISLA